MEQWTPVRHVKASDEEWYKIVERGLRLGLVDTVDEADIFRDHNGKLVLNGATSVPKLKRLPDGSIVELQRFISNLVLMIAYFRRLRGDSSLLPPVSRLGFVVLHGGFNSFRMSPVWNSFLAFAKKSIVQCTPL